MTTYFNNEDLLVNAAAKGSVDDIRLLFKTKGSGTFEPFLKAALSAGRRNPQVVRYFLSMEPTLIEDISTVAGILNFNPDASLKKDLIKKKMTEEQREKVMLYALDMTYLDAIEALAKYGTRCTEEIKRRAQERGYLSVRFCVQMNKELRRL